jgi:hypothetical protein
MSKEKKQPKELKTFLGLNLLIIITLPLQKKD